MQLVETFGHVLEMLFVSHEIDGTMRENLLKEEGSKEEKERKRERKKKYGHEKGKRRIRHWGLMRENTVMIKGVKEERLKGLSYEFGVFLFCLQYVIDC